MNYITYHLTKSLIYEIYILRLNIRRKFIRSLLPEEFTRCTPSER